MIVFSSHNFLPNRTEGLSAFLPGLRLVSSEESKTLFFVNFAKITSKIIGAIL